MKVHCDWLKAIPENIHTPPVEGFFVLHPPSPQERKAWKNFITTVKLTHLQILFAQEFLVLKNVYLYFSLELCGNTENNFYTGR